MEYGTWILEVGLILSKRNESNFQNPTVPKDSGRSMFQIPKNISNHLFVRIFVITSMNSANPFRVLVFMGGVALILGLTAILLPKKGVELGAVKLKFLSGEEILNAKTIEKKDITSIVEKVNTEEIAESKLIGHKNTSKGNVGSPSVVNYVESSSTGLYLNTKSKSDLDRFFGKLQSLAASKKKIRVLHFGDSQIEGDRMTGFIRQRMQEKFGGNGPGLIPATNVYPTLAYRQDFSDNFVRYTCFGGPKLSNKRYGVQNSAARFTPEGVDTNTVEQEGWISVGPNGAAHGRAQTFNNVKMFYNSCTVPCNLKVYQGETVIHEENLNTDGGTHTVNLGFASTPSNLKFVFKSLKSPNINGFSLEGDFGVQVDNIAMRGSSGTFFGSVDRNSFANMMNELEVELAIMQFGGNSMPYLKDSAAVRQYARFFKGQLLTLKKLKPDLAIVMIGPSDMSKLQNGEYLTYPLLPYCIKKLKEAALSAGAGYWDLYSAMGGKNSMPSWVEKDLGRPDHVHFSIKGATIAAQLFYDAFMGEYTKFEGQ
jgi:hypothetical protein